MSEIRYKGFEKALRVVTPEHWWFKKQTLTPELYSAWMQRSSNLVNTYDCRYLHANHCMVEGSIGAVRWLMRAYKTYVIIHLAQHLLFKKDKFKSKSLLVLVKNILRTLAFFTVYAFLAKFGWCYGACITGSFTPLMTLFFCSLGASAVLLERNSRWPEFAMNLFPKFLESIPPYFRKQQYWIDVPFGHNILLGLALSAITNVYFTSPETLKKMFVSFGKLIIGCPLELTENNEKKV